MCFVALMSSSVSIEPGQESDGKSVDELAEGVGIPEDRFAEAVVIPKLGKDLNRRSDALLDRRIVDIWQRIRWIEAEAFGKDPKRLPITFGSQLAIAVIE